MSSQLALLHQDQLKPTAASSIKRKPAFLRWDFGIGSIESSELRRISLNRVHAQHPEQREADVNVKVIRKKNSRFINIIALSADPHLAQLFLDGLVDEFMLLRQSMTERSQNQWPTVHAEGIAKLEKLKKEVQQKLAQAQSSKLPEWEIERLKLDLDYYQKTASTMLTKVRAQQAIFDKRVDPISIVDRASAAVLNKAK